MNRLFSLIFLLAFPLFGYAVGGDFSAPPGTIEVGTASALISKIIAFAIGLTGVMGVIGMTW